MSTDKIYIETVSKVVNGHQYLLRSKITGRLFIMNRDENDWHDPNEGFSESTVLGNKEVIGIIRSNEPTFKERRKKALEQLTPEQRKVLGL